MIDSLLSEQGLEPAHIDAFAFASGPGAFTGLRVACALAQGLAFGSDRPVIPVGSLRALALAACAGACGGERVLAATDARMGQVYWAVFEADGQMRSLAPASLADPAQLAQLVQSWHPDVLAGDALCVYEAHWPARPGVVRRPQARADAAAVARLACIDWVNGRALAARDAAPEYVRDQVAQTLAQRRAAAAGATG